MIVEINFRKKRNLEVEEWAKGLLEATSIKQPKRKSSTKKGGRVLRGSSS